MGEYSAEIDCIGPTRNLSRFLNKKELTVNLKTFVGKNPCKKFQKGYCM